MKNMLHAALIAFVLTLASFTSAWTQTSCLPNGITFTTQEEIDNFPVNYPGCTEIEGLVQIQGLNIYNVDSLYNINSILGNLEIKGTFLINLSGLDNLESVHDIGIWENDLLETLNGLENLKSIQQLAIYANNSLLNISAISSDAVIYRIIIIANNLLSYCATEAICKYMTTNCPDEANCLLWISGNGSDCNSALEVAKICNHDIIYIKNQFSISENSDCFEPKILIENMSSIFIIISEDKKKIHNFNANEYKAIIRPDDDEKIGVVPLNFNYSFWLLCEDTLWIDHTEYGDTIHADLLLMPLANCPELTMDLGLPPAFRGCLVSTDMRVRTQNTGTIPAENVELAVVFPFDLMEVESALPPPVAQSGDTLFFALGDLEIFQVADVHLTVRTRCDTFLLGHTICIEAFAEMDNPCPPDLPQGSLVQARASCVGEDKVVFTLTNIGDEPTDVPHHYFIIEDEVVLLSDEFQLNVLESIEVEVDATGATLRMEATKRPNGMLTAAALEGCGGFTPGMINAFWLDQGESNYAIGCRQVILAYDPNDKLAIPTGVGPAHLLAANRPIEYTIRFQNTGTDTAFRVLLTDILPPQLDVSTFRPGFASHDYTWEIRGLDTLEVLFFPIALPDSAASPEGSQGFFSFSIDQKPDLPDGTLIQNTASIIFDFNPPIITNTFFHTIGKLSVHIDQHQPHGAIWFLHGNPTRDQAVFRSPLSIPGEKRFELFDLMGRAVRQVPFEGNEYVFQRGALRSGIYLFRISDARGHHFTGKIVIAE